MTFRGHIKNGVVVLDEDVSLPEGTEIILNVMDLKPSHGPAEDVFWGLFSLSGDLMDHIVSDIMSDRTQRRFRDVNV